MNTTVKVFGLKMNSQNRRRGLVVMVYLSYLVILLPFWLAHHLTKPLLLLALPAFVVWGACFWSLSRVARAYAYPSGMNPADHADEREAQVRDRSFARAYWIFSSVICLGLLYRMLANDFGWLLPKEAALQSIFFGLLLLSATLPSSVVTWNERDIPDETADELLVQH